MSKRLLTDLLIVAGVLLLACILAPSLPPFVASLVTQHAAHWLALAVCLVGVVALVTRFLRYFR